MLKKFHDKKQRYNYLFDKSQIEDAVSNKLWENFIVLFNNLKYFFQKMPVVNTESASILF